MTGMIHETKRKENRKEKKFSSDEMIDSFFDSNYRKDEPINHKPKENIRDTERLIDEILSGKTHSDKSIDELHPTITTVGEKEKENKNEHCFPCQKDCLDARLDKPDDVDEKKEVFELDTPGKKIQDVDAPDIVKGFASSDENEQTKKSLNKKDEKKIRFSFSLPKINVKIKKRKKPSVKERESAYKHQQKPSVSPESSIQTKDTIDSKISERIHNSPKINTKESPDIKPEGEGVVNKNNKSFFKSTMKSKTFFSKKTDDKQSSKQIHTSNEQDGTYKTKTAQSFEGAVDEDIIKLLRITDGLLGKLPDDIIEEFSQSDDFALYEKVMKKYDVIK